MKLPGDCFCSGYSTKGCSVGSLFQVFLFFDFLDFFLWLFVLIFYLDRHFLISKLVLKQMKIQSGGVILITASNAGVFPDYGMVGYITSKAAAVMLVEQLALDLAEYNIRVNCICPGWVDTPFNDPYTKQLGGRKELEKVVKSRVPLKRFGTAEEVADAILFLVSDQSSYITGHSLVIDGGEKLVGAGPK